MARQVTLKGNPLKLEGPELKIGDRAPDATLKKSLVDKVRLADLPPKARIYSVVPSLDTPVCAQQTKRFNEEAAALDPDIVIVTVSTDLPYALKNWCAANGIERVQLYSDAYDTNFGQAYGTLIKDRRILRRAVFVADRKGKVVYADYMKALGDQPDYEAVLAAAGTDCQSEAVYVQPKKERTADDPQRRRPDITRAKEILGWEPRVMLEDGLKETIAYFRSVTTHLPA